MQHFIGRMDLMQVGGSRVCASDEDDNNKESRAFSVPELTVFSVHTECYGIYRRRLKNRSILDFVGCLFVFVSAWILSTCSDFPNK